MSLLVVLISHYKSVENLNLIKSNHLGSYLDLIKSNHLGLYLSSLLSPASLEPDNLPSNTN